MQAKTDQKEGPKSVDTANLVCSLSYLDVRSHSALSLKSEAERHCVEETSLGYSSTA